MSIRSPIQELLKARGLPKFFTGSRTGVFSMVQLSYHSAMPASKNKFLIDSKTFNALSEKSCVAYSSKPMSQMANEDVGPYEEGSGESTWFLEGEDRLFCRNFIQNQTHLPVQWESLEQSLRIMKTKDFSSTILRSCEILRKGELAIDYCQYIINKNERLSFLEICLLIRALSTCDTDFPKHEKFIKTIFDLSSETVLNLEVIVKNAMNVFCCSNSCYKELLTLYKEGKIHVTGMERLMVATFDNNDPELGWEMAKEHPEKFTYSVVESYLKFCLRMAEQNKFSVDMISDLVEFSKINTIVIKYWELYNYIDQLISVLNKSETGGYLWSVHEVEIVNTNVCSLCQYKFKPETVKPEELEELKKHFLNKVIISSNINMKTTQKELDRFFMYLKQCKPYNIVIDALNLFSGTKSRKKLGKKLLQHFERKGMRVLLIGKSHFKNFDLYPEIEEKRQIFLTRNDSLDDVFCLYAAMHQGVNTYFYTSDFLRDHAKFFDDHSTNLLFRKWQISHQYVLQGHHTLLHPRSHSDISQSSVVLDENNKVKEYCWHLSYLKKGQQYRLETPAEWICLRARSKTATK